MRDPIKVFIGYDPRQPVAYQVLAHSVWSRASQPIAITRLQLSQLPIKRRGLTEFTFSRFLVPYLSAYDGHSVFLDSDMLCLGDILDLVALACADHLRRRQEDKAIAGPQVWVVKNVRKFEWPSMMVFNNAACRLLTPEWVEDEKNNPYDMQSWAPEIGDLPPFWNHLVGYDAPNPQAKLIHFTQGIPCWPETRGCEFSKEWQVEGKRSFATVSFEDLMGKSVHAKHVQARLQAQAAAAGLGDGSV